MNIKNITVAGSGQIGTSIAMDVTRLLPGINLALYDIKSGIEHEIKKAFRTAKVSFDRAKFCSKSQPLPPADMVVLATPIDQFANTIFAIKNRIQPDAIIIDVGSVKDRPSKEIRAALNCAGLQNVKYIPCHPMNGNSGSGPSTASINLFKDKPVFVVPSNTGFPDRLGKYIGAEKTVRDFWKALGGKICSIDAQTHDSVVATTSHLEHVLMFSLMNSGFVKDYIKEQEGLPPAKRTPPGKWFMGMTRIADAGPEMWLPVFEANKESLVTAARQFSFMFSYTNSTTPKALENIGHYAAKIVCGKNSAGATACDAAAHPLLNSAAFLISAGIGANLQLTEKSLCYKIAPVANRSLKDGLMPIAAANMNSICNSVYCEQNGSGWKNEFLGAVERIVQDISSADIESLRRKIIAAGQNRQRLDTLIC